MARTRRVARKAGLDTIVEATNDEYYSYHSSVRPSILRKCSRSQSEKFFEAFYGHDENEQRDFFPNGTEIGRYVERVLRVPWFNPKREYMQTDLEPYVDQISLAFRLYLNKKPLLTPEGIFSREDIMFDFDNVNRLIIAVAEATGFEALCNEVKNIAYYYAQNCRNKGVPAGIAAKPAVQNAIAGAAYIVTGLPQQENQFAKLLAVYELGLWPIGVNSKGRLVIWHPKVEKETKELRE